jgi:ketosteroid isomerase-like protein
MSAADLEFIREMLETFNRGERARSLGYLHDDVELEQWGALPDSDDYVGKEEWQRGLRLWLDEFEPDFKFIPEELTDAGGSVVARITLRGRGRASGVEIDQEIFHVYEVREGKLRRCRVFTDETEARRAAGLED